MHSRRIRYERGLTTGCSWSKPFSFTNPRPSEPSRSVQRSLPMVRRCAVSGEPDYIFLATEALDAAAQASDPAVAESYLRLAGSYMALARFRDRAQVWARVANSVGAAGGLNPNGVLTGARHRVAGARLFTARNRQTDSLGPALLACGRPHRPRLLDRAAPGEFPSPVRVKTIFQRPSADALAERRWT